MKRSTEKNCKGCPLHSAFLAAFILLASSGLSFAEENTQIECTTPDGHVLAVATASEQTPNAPTLTDPGTLSCRLQEGQTTFVIKLPAAALLDRFTFVNENVMAAGQLKISVSNDRLPVESAQWVAVDGNIPFSHKRLFNVSMVGVEARYLKLSFNVEKTVRLAGN